MLVLATLASGWHVACVSYVDIAAGQRGSLEAPIQCDSPEGQRRYLRRLLKSDGDRAEFEYRGAVIGPEHAILDRFVVENPALDERGPLELFLDLFRNEPYYAPAYRLHMSIYGAPCEDGPPPGFSFGGGG